MPWVGQRCDQPSLMQSSSSHGSANTTQQEVQSPPSRSAPPPRPPTRQRHRDVDALPGHAEGRRGAGGRRRGRLVAHPAGDLVGRHWVVHPVELRLFGGWVGGGGGWRGDRGGTCKHITTTTARVGWWGAGPVVSGATSSATQPSLASMCRPTTLHRCWACHSPAG